jgi:hypothetical protein
MTLAVSVSGYVSLLATGQQSGRIEPDALAAMQPSAIGASVAMDGLIDPAMLVSRVYAHGW